MYNAMCFSELACLARSDHTSSWHCVKLSENKALHTHWSSKTESPHIAGLLPPILAFQFSFVSHFFIMCSIVHIHPNQFLLLGTMRLSVTQNLN